MVDDSRAIVTELDDAIAIIRFNKPLERNYFSLQTLHELNHSFSELSVRDDVRAIIFVGTDEVFASGANIRELAQLQPDSALEFSKFGQCLFQKIAGAKNMTIAAINGYCMGGALDLALACDLRVAATDAVLAHPGVRLGIITGWGGTQRLPRLIGTTAALELLLTGRRLTANEAFDLGLVTRVTNHPLQTARSIARNFARQLLF